MREMKPGLGMGQQRWVRPIERDPQWTVARAMREAAAQCPSGRPDAGFTFLLPDGGRHHHTFPSLVAEVQRRGRHLLAAGLVKGDKVALVIPEPEEFVLTFLACLETGIVAVPMFPPLSFGKLDAYIDSTARILEAADATVLLTSKRVQTVLWSLIDRVERLSAIHTVESFFARPEPARPVPPSEPPRPEDVAFLQFTSGSTALPKGVIVTNESLGANVWAIMVDGLEIDPAHDVAVTWLPLYHDMGLIGMMICPLTWGVRTVFLDTLSFVKHPTRWMQACSEHRGTITFAPNFAYALAARRTRPEQLARLDLAPLRVIGCGAEPNHPGTLHTFLEAFAPAGLRPEALLPVYGMAEATLAMAFSRLEDRVRVDRVESEPYTERGHAIAAPQGIFELDASTVVGETLAARQQAFVTCGRALRGHEILIVDDDGRVLPDRQVGEIVFRGPSVASGYYRNPEATAQAFTALGLRTGDLGYLVDGELFVTGRKKDVIILNGRNYDPQSIEWLAAEVEGVRKGNVVAFSVPGERTEALVVVAERHPEADREAVAAAVRERVQQELFLKVDEIVLVERGALPKTSSGKLQRSRTRQQYLDGVLGQEGVRTLGDKGQTLSVVKHVTRSAVSRVRHGVRSSVSGLVAALRTDGGNGPPPRIE